MSDQTFRASCVWVRPGRCHAPGEIRVRGGSIVSVGPTRGAKIPRRVIVPALVNGHVHLQIPRLARPERNFLSWVRSVMQTVAKRSPKELGRSAEAALHDLRRDGVGAVGEIDSTGESLDALRSAAMGGVRYTELTGFHLDARGAASLLQSRPARGTRYCRPGLSPHAPYSVSGPLFRAARNTGLPLAVHVAEIEEELQFLRQGDGPFRDLLESLGRLPPGFRAPGVAPIEHLRRLGLLRPSTALIHAQHITPAEASLIAREGAPIVVCPGTIRYFRRDPPPLGDWLAKGIPIALGTDSRASNSRLSMRHEMRLARRLWPAVDPETVLGMATTSAGRALGSRSLGTLGRGAVASFLTIPLGSSGSRPLSAGEGIDAFTSGELAPDGIWLRGAPLADPRT